MTPALSPHRPAHGFSLIELMVAMSIGLILTLIIGQIFINSRAVFASTDNLSRLQENARYGFNLISREVRSAGFKSDSRPTPDPAFAAPFAAIQGTDGGTAGTPASGVPDLLTVRFQGNGTAPPGNADGTAQDCLGARVPYGTVVTNTFLVQADPANNNEPTLYCNTDAAAPTVCAALCYPLVPGVENMQILYGEDFFDWTAGAVAGQTDGSADRWLTAPNVGSWDNVVSVRMSLLMRTADRVADRPTPNTTFYAMSGTNVYAPGNDTRLRRVFTMVINLRNRTP